MTGTQETQVEGGKPRRVLPEQMPSVAAFSLDASVFDDLYQFWEGQGILVTLRQTEVNGVWHATFMLLDDFKEWDREGEIVGSILRAFWLSEQPDYVTATITETVDSLWHALQAGFVVNGSIPATSGNHCLIGWRLRQ